MYMYVCTLTNTSHAYTQVTLLTAQKRELEELTRTSRVDYARIRRQIFDQVTAKDLDTYF